MMGKVEHWVHTSGAVRVTEQNPCGCCSEDFTWETLWPNEKKSWIGSVRDMTRRKFRNWMNETGWEKLG